MKRTILVLLLISLHFLVFGQQITNVNYQGTHDGLVDSTYAFSSVRNSRLNPVHPNGNSSLGQSFVLEDVCGLNYVMRGLETTTRASFELGSGFPATDTIKGLPVSACLNVIKAYLYYGVSYTETAPPTTTATITNPVLNTNTYASTIIGTGPAKFWSETGTAAYQADVTAAIAGNGNYVINLNGFANPAWEVDGLTLVIIYSYPASYSGSISLWDGQVTKTAFKYPYHPTLSGFSVCASTSIASAFGCYGDMQNNITPNTNTETFNGSTASFPNNFWNTNVIPTNLVNGQTGAVYSSYTNDNSDGYSWILAGLYWQNTTCVTCNPDSTTQISVTINTTNPTPCAYNNGIMTAHASGGVKPYTYLWSPGGGTDSIISGLSSGTYTVFVTDSNGCGVATASLTSHAALNVSLSPTNLACHSAKDGSILAVLAGGVTPFTYLWTGGKTTSSITGLSAGTYTLKVTDSTGCSASASVSITQPLTSVTIAIKSYTDPTCNGGTGSATADTAKGGTPYSASGIINTLAGTGGSGYGGDGGLATAALLNQPWGTTMDGSGNVYIADRINNVVRMVNSSGIITTFAGNGANNSLGDGGPATAAGVQSPTGVTVDGSGNVYITEWQAGYVIRKVNTSGIISKVAGNGSSVSNGDGGAATAAGINGPTGVAVDGTGNIFIADYAGNKIRMVNTSGIINTIVNIPGSAGHAGDGGPATAAQLNAPFGVSLDGAGNLYIAEFSNNDVRKVNTSGIINTIAGTSLGFSGDGGPATAAKLDGSDGVFADRVGNIYIADTYNNRIRLVNSSGIISTVAGNGSPGESGDGGPATSASLYSPSSVFVDGSGNVYTADWQGNKVRKFGSNSLYTYIWTPNGGTNLTATGLSTGTYTITATDAMGCTGYAKVTITQPIELKITARETYEVSCNGLSDGSATCNITVGTPPYTYLWTTGGTNSTVSGLSAGTYTVEASDSTGACALAHVTITQPPVLSAYTSILSYISCNGMNNGSAAIYASGGSGTDKYLWSNGKTKDTITSLISGTYSITVTDRHGCTATATAVITQPATLITKASVISNVSCNGLTNGSAFATTSGGTGNPYNIITVGGNGSADSTGDGGPAIYAKLNTPEGVCVDKKGNIYIADMVNNKVRKINKSGIITTIAGTGLGGYNGDGRSATSAFLNLPIDVAVDDSGNVFFADNANNRIRKINSSGIISTVAGDGLAGSTGDGTLATAAEINAPAGVAFDHSGNMYIGDFNDNKVRVVNTAGIINTFAGNGTQGSGGDGGPATSANLYEPQGLAVDDSGNVYIADIANDKVRVVNKAGIINTFAGTGTFGYNGDSIQATTAELNTPQRIAIDHSGNVYLSDEYNNRIRKVNTSGLISTIAGNGTAGYNGDNIIATTAEINNPIGVAVDDSGNVYLSDKLNERIRKVLPGYNYLWTPGNLVGQNVYNLSAATYTVTVSDVNGCSASSSVIISQPNVLNASTSFSNVTCNGLNNGSASTTINGGTTPYTYSWTNGGTSSAISGLSQGSYSLTVLDINACSVTQTVTITEPTILNVSAFPRADVGCYGDSSGSAGSTVSGGTLPYTYLWTGGSTNTALSTIKAGTYTLIVTDGNGCLATASATITQPLVPLSVGIAAKNNVLCNGGTGWATASPATGGTSPYIYYWAPSGGTNLHASGLSAGTYTIIAIDAHLCLTTDTVIISQPPPLIGTAVITTNISCNNGNSGSAVINVSGGTLPYSYTWSNGGTNAILTGLSAGAYSVYVLDSNGCNTSASVTITQPPSLSVSANITSTISCNGGSASASATASGGTTPYTYNWSNSLTTANINGLSQGTYTIIVTDSCGSQATASVIITQPNPLVITIASQNNVLCNGGTGSAIANSATGGTPPYIYDWTPSGGTNTTASGLSAGTYSITVKDANGCSSNASVTITQPTILLGSSTVNTNVACYSGNDGSASENNSGGTSPYSYSWSNSLTTSNVSGLTAGAYTVTVTDFNGCTKIDSVTITQPSLLTVLAKDAKNVNCNDSASGSVSATPAGGTLPYTYSWSNGATNALVTGLTSGGYTITITDNNGCSTSSAATVKQTTAFIIARDSVMDNGNCTGVASIKISGGTKPYTFLWTPGNQTTDSISGLCAGIYCCLIIDSNNCQENICMTIKTAVGIASIKNSTSISVYPDPNNGFFNITGLIRGQIVELYNCLGQKLNSEIAGDETLHIDISSRPDAVYLLRVKNKDGSFVFQEKIVKTN